MQYLLTEEMSNFLDYQKSSLNLNNDEDREKLVAYMTQKFLSWKLPVDFSPDGGITFQADYGLDTDLPGKYTPMGTNLFTAAQASAMFRFLLSGYTL